MPKRRQPTPDELEHAERVRGAAADRLTEVERERRAGIRGDHVREPVEPSSEEGDGGR